MLQASFAQVLCLALEVPGMPFLLFPFSHLSCPSPKGPPQGKAAVPSAHILSFPPRWAGLFTWLAFLSLE